MLTGKQIFKKGIVTKVAKIRLVSALQLAKAVIISVAPSK